MKTRIQLLLETTDFLEIGKMDEGCYKKLIQRRKECNLCYRLTNPSKVENGKYDDTEQIGPWSRWQGNIKSEIMIIGQDWGTVKYFREHKGLEEHITKNPTNENLRKLLSSLGIKIDRPTGYETVGEIFLTNAILCLKEDDGKGLQSKVYPEWFKNCGKKFLKPLIQCLKPKIIITLGMSARDSILDVYNIDDRRFRRTMIESIKNSPDGIKLDGNILLFPVYHCGASITNRTRTIDEQLNDWSRIKKHYC